MQAPVRTTIRILLLALLPAAACERVRYDPARATRPYPRELHSTDAVDIQVFRKGESIEIVNSTPYGYRGADLWINQRYMHRLDGLPAGATVKLSLWDFYDERGSVFIAGGLLRTEEPVPVRLVEIQTGPDQPLVGLITILAERPEYGGSSR